MSEKIIREQLTHLLLADQSHMSLEEAVKDFPEKNYNTIPPNVTYTFWHLLEHIRITQRDILDYLKQKNYRELKWPDEYWPETASKTDQKGWAETVERLIKDRDELIGMAKKGNLYAVIPDSPGHTLFREIIVVGNHNSYHIGEFAVLRQVLNNWKKTQFRLSH